MPYRSQTLCDFNKSRLLYLNVALQLTVFAVTVAVLALDSRSWRSGPVCEALPICRAADILDVTARQCEAMQSDLRRLFYGYSVIISATTLKLLIVLGLVLTSTDAVSAVLFDPGQQFRETDGLAGQQFRETDGLAWRTAYVACTAWALSSAVDIALLVGLLFRETVMRPSIAGYATHLFPYSVAMASSWTPTVTLSTAAMAVSVLDAVMLRASWKLC